MSGELVDDVHSRLNETLVDSVVPVDSLESIGTAIDFAHAARRPVVMPGGTRSRSRCSCRSRSS